MPLTIVRLPSSSQLASYLTQSSASATYLTQASASTTYLTKSSASTTYATKSSPTFTGTPLSTTASVNTNNTQIATTAFVLGQASSTTPIVNGTGTVGTSYRYSRQDHIHPTDTSRSALDSPTFTGTPAAPTASFGTNTTQLATTAFVQSAVKVVPIISKTSAYTVGSGDEGDLIELNGTFTVSIPTDATFNFTIGTQINLLNIGTGVITIAAVTPGTTTVNGTPGLKLRAQWSSATLIKRAANLWVLVGDLTV